MTFVAIKMGRRQGGPSRTGAWRAHPAPLFCSRGQTEQTRNEKSGAGRNRRATQPPAIFIATLRAAAKDMLFRGQDTNKTTSPGMRSRRAAQPARRKLWLHELNGRRETRTRERIRYSQSLSGVPQRWLWSARDSGKAGKQKRKWNYGSIGMLYHSMFPDGNACHETPTISCSSVRRLAICSTCASTRSAALKVTLITVRASSVPTSLSIL
jgi:hypothetical protein